MNELELMDTLRRLTPMAAKVDAVSAAFVAGQSSGRAQVRLWRGVSVVCLLLCGGIWMRGMQSVPPRAAGESTVATVTDRAVAPLSDESAIKLQEAVLDGGLDGMPRLQLPVFTPVRTDDLL